MSTFPHANIAHFAQVTDLSLVFSVKGHADKHKAHTVASQGSFSWGEHTLDIDIPDPTNASLEVRLMLSADLKEHEHIHLDSSRELSYFSEAVFPRIYPRESFP